MSLATLVAIVMHCGNNLFTLVFVPFYDLSSLLDWSAGADSLLMFIDITGSAGATALLA